MSTSICSSTDDRQQAATRIAAARTIDSRQQHQSTVQTRQIVTVVPVAIHHQAFFRGPPTTLSVIRFFYIFCSGTRSSSLHSASQQCFSGIGLCFRVPSVFGFDLHGGFVDVSLLEAALFSWRCSLLGALRWHRTRFPRFCLPSGCAASIGVEDGDENYATQTLADACSQCIVLLTFWSL